METLDFTLKPEAAAKIHEILMCLAKFSDTVAIEARRERLSFTALNSSKSAYASCSLEGKTFFSTYECRPKDSAPDGRFTCSMYSKALLSVFKPRLDDARGKDTAIDRCEVSVQDRPDKTECRFVVKMVCNQGVTKTYKLTYESVEILHALFDKNAAKNHWSISSGLLREYIEYFGRRTEQLDIYAEEDRVVFTSFTEKIANGKEILKQPLQTAVAVNVSDFENFTAQERMHTIISVKDFRAIVLHADTLKTSLNAHYSHPTRPLQFNYTSDGMYCEFTLMTAGDYVDTPPPPPSAAPVGPSRTTSRGPSTTTERSESRSFRQDMPPPPAPTTRTSATSARRLGNSRAARKAPSPVPSEDSESLFVGVDEDTQWDPADSRNDEETLGWDASAENDAGMYPTFRDSGSLARVPAEESADGVAPTQRISQIKGLW